MVKRERLSSFRGNRCRFCGASGVPCTDNGGQSYMGCPRCVLVYVPEEKTK